MIHRLRDAGWFVSRVYPRDHMDWIKTEWAHDIRELDEALDAHRASGAPPAPDLLDDPEMADVREQISAEFERRWLDVQIPALGGRTPREAALDPIGRHELERLLVSFGDGPNLMDVARLRKALGL